MKKLVLLSLLCIVAYAGQAGFSMNNPNDNNKNQATKMFDDFEILEDEDDKDENKINNNDNDGYLKIKYKNDNIDNMKIEQLYSENDIKSLKNQIKYPIDKYSNKKINDYDNLTREQKRMLDYFYDWSYVKLDSLSTVVNIQIVTNNNENALIKAVLKQMITLVNNEIKKRSSIKSWTNTLSDYTTHKLWNTDISNHELESLFINTFTKDDNVILKSYLIDAIHRNIYRVIADAKTQNDMKKVKKDLRNINLSINTQQMKLEEKGEELKKKHIDELYSKVNDINSQEYELDKIEETAKLIEAKRQQQEQELNKDFSEFKNQLQRKTNDDLLKNQKDRNDIIQKYSISDNNQHIPDNRKELFRKAIQNTTKLYDKDTSEFLYTNQLNEELLELQRNINNTLDKEDKRKMIEATKSKIKAGYITNPYIIKYMDKNYK